MNPKGALTLKELAVDHVHTTLYDEDWQWQPPLSGALRGLTAAQAAWQPAPAQDAVLRRLETLADAVNRLPDLLTRRHPATPWREKYGFRNIARARLRGDRSRTGLGDCRRLSPGSQSRH